MKVSRFPLLLLLALACLFPQSARAVIFEVTKTADTSDGSCDVTDCSLRECRSPTPR